MFLSSLSNQGGNMVKCPLCDKGELKKGKIKETMFGVFLGEFPADICSSCGDSFTDEKTTQLIQEAAKKKGVWGLGFKKDYPNRKFSCNSYSSKDCPIFEIERRRGSIYSS